MEAMTEEIGYLQDTCSSMRALAEAGHPWRRDYENEIEEFEADAQFKNDKILQLERKVRKLQELLSLEQQKKRGESISVEAHEERMRQRTDEVREQAAEGRGLYKAGDQETKATIRKMENEELLQRALVALEKSMRKQQDDMVKSALIMYK